jgi:hypothetical protein
MLVTKGSLACKQGAVSMTAVSVFQTRGGEAMKQGEKAEIGLEVNR